MAPNMAIPTSVALSTPLQEEGVILDKGIARYLLSNPWQWFEVSSHRTALQKPIRSHHLPLR
jgi:hypothetical protein